MGMKNYMEKMVEEILEDLLKKYPEYKEIEVAKAEVVALSLNKLEALYGTTDLGHALLESKIVDNRFRSKVISIVIEAIEKIKENPLEKYFPRG
ncbi:late competence development ComFB family protein [candidate division WOR-3 bacterium]|nr:late competence development ComFB family protein [candidate division WOR-3 bacterium]MCK4527989.1 late competence development ComFB family protein [candidate division WOR-3 bacterium]